MTPSPVTEIVVGAWVATLTLTELAPEPSTPELVEYARGVVASPVAAQILATAMTLPSVQQSVAGSIETPAKGDEKPAPVKLFYFSMALLAGVAGAYVQLKENQYGAEKVKAMADIIAG